MSWDGDLQMPPKRMPAKEQIDDLKRWIAMGAPDPCRLQDCDIEGYLAN
jgi:hypothetical protein